MNGALPETHSNYRERPSENHAKAGVLNADREREPSPLEQSQTTMHDWEGKKKEISSNKFMIQIMII